MEGKKKKLTGRWKREMREYRWNLIWKAVLVNALALVVFIAASLWVREKANIEIGNYFDDTKSQVQDYVISWTLNTYASGNQRAEYITRRIEETDRHMEPDGFSYATRIYVVKTGEEIFEDELSPMDDRLQQFITQKMEQNGQIGQKATQVFQERIYGKARGDYLIYGEKIFYKGEDCYIVSAMYANPFTWGDQWARLLHVGFYGYLTIFFVSLLVIVHGCRKKKQNLRSREKQEEMMLAIAHDIRGPLMAIGGYAENMGQLIEAEEGRHYRDEILSNVAYMNSMITNMICYLKDQEADKSEKSAVSIREIFEKKAAQYQDLIGKNKLTIGICGDVKLQTDAKMFGYIADNLVTNAVKYAKPETEVQIQIDKDSVVVRNQAALIPDCTPEELWNPTKKGDDVRTGRNGGGMGLGIVRRFLNACGYTGEIRMEDGVFEVTINLK